MRLRNLLGVCAIALTAITPAHAVGTRVFDIHTLEEFSGGDLAGVSVGSDGVVRAGFKLGDLRVPGATTVFAALPRADGSVLLATSPGGKIMRVMNDQVSELADTKATGVTSLAEDAHGNVYAGTFPDGKIYKVSQNKAEVFTTLPESTYVWALAFDRTKTNLYAAVGLEQGRVFRVNAAGQAEVLYRSDEPHLVSLAVAPNGDVLAGSSGKGLLYRITGPGRATVLYDFPGEEVKAVAAAQDGTIWAIANEYAEPPEVPRRTASSLRGAAGPANTSSRPKPGKGQLWRIDPRGRPEKMMGHNEFHYMALALDDAGAPYVGTGAEGRVYTVDDAHAVTLVANTHERQVTAISLAGLPKDVAHPGPGAFVVSSDGAVFHSILARGGVDAVWTSKVFDTGARARFGTLSFRASASIELSTRSGNTQTPDNTWSQWSAGATVPTIVASPAAHYVQVRARLLRADTELSEVVLPFVTDNLRPVVTDVSAQSKSTVRETKEGLAPSGGEPPKHDSVVHVIWRVDNPDQDALRYRLWYRRDLGGEPWRDMLRSDETVSKPEYDWETATLPEGKYRIRVEASDEVSNPPDQALKHSFETSGVLVDNTPPVFAGLSMQGRRLKARVVDGVGPITRVDVSVDGRADWRPLAPVSGVYDAADETFDSDVTAVVPANTTTPHIVAVRAFDGAGNYVVREIPSP